MKRFLWLLIPCGLIAAAIGAGTATSGTHTRPEIRVVQTAVRGSQQFYILELVNPTHQELEYWGYSPSSPMYEMEVLEHGDWKGGMIGWCGTGAAPQRLSAGSRQRFEVYVRDAPARIGLLLLPPNYQREHVFQFEWLPIAMRLKLVKWQNDRLDEKLKRKVVWSEQLEPLPPLTALTTGNNIVTPEPGGVP